MSFNAHNNSRAHAAKSKERFFVVPRRYKTTKRTDFHLGKCSHLLSLTDHVYNSGIPYSKLVHVAFELKMRWLTGGEACVTAVEMTDNSWQARVVWSPSQQALCLSLRACPKKLFPQFTQVSWREISSGDGGCLLARSRLLVRIKLVLFRFSLLASSGGHADPFTGTGHRQGRRRNVFGIYLPSGGTIFRRSCRVAASSIDLRRSKSLSAAKDV